MLKKKKLYWLKEQFLNFFTTNVEPRNGVKIFFLTIKMPLETDGNTESIRVV